MASSSSSSSSSDSSDGGFISDFEGLEALNYIWDFEPSQTSTQLNEECGSTCDEGKESVDADKIDGEFHLAQETFEGTPRSDRSKSSSSEIFSSSIPKKKHGHRPISGKPATSKSQLRQPLSSIPLPVKSSGPIIKVAPIIKNVKSNSRTGSMTACRTLSVANKHTLEIQFINKNKRYIQMKKEIVDRQRPVLDLYQSLVQIKNKLEELGKKVKLEEIKVLTYEEYNKPLEMHGAGEHVSIEVVAGMKHSIEEIPKTLMDICKNLLSRRALIVELLESVTKSEVDVSEVSDKIESLKNEGQQLQHSLDAVISEHQSKINVLVANWQKLLNEKQSYNTDNKIEELENKLESQEKLTQESNNIIHELYKKMEDRKSVYDRSIAELNGVISSLKEQIKKLEQDLENEKKSTVDFKTRNNTNSQNLKTMRARITELENEKTFVESSNAEMQKKVRLLQDQLKHKEASWCREREELNKNLKHQENLLQKLTADKNQFETRFKKIETEKKSTETTLQSTINSLNIQLSDTNHQLEEITIEKNAALDKCSEFENYIARMRIECRETMNKVSYSIEWGKDVSAAPAAENYIQEIAKDLRIRELEDRINYLEKSKMEYFDKEFEPENLQNEPSRAVIPLPMQACISRYQLLLQESENKLQERSAQMEKLRSEILQLKVRQVALEEQNSKCPTGELQNMMEEGQRKLQELMKRSIESEHTVEKYVDVIEKQTHQINDMENLLRYRENMTKVLKTSRDELIQEKESLIRYSQEIKTLLAEVTKQSKIKEALTRELEEKVYLREDQVIELKELVQKLEADVIVANEKRFKLQETIEVMQNQLQNTMRMDTRYKNRSSQKSDHVEEHFIIPSKIKNGTLQKFSRYKKLSGHGRINSLAPTKLQKTSNNRMENLNFSMFSDSNSDHLNCQHKVNSRSLISLSLQTVDFLKTRLNFLTSVNMLSEENVDISSAQKREDNQITSSAQTTRRKKVSQENVGKILKLSAQRYKYLQNQANESYEDLSKLVKIAATQQCGLKK